MKRTLIACFALALSGCSQLDGQLLFNQLDMEVLDGPTETTNAFVRTIDGAQEELAIALPLGSDENLTGSILDAHDRGVSVKLVIDHDQQEDTGFAQLIEAGVPTTLADDGLSYFEFNFKDDVGWSSEQTIMSSAFVVADRQRFISATTAGGLTEGPRISVSGIGETLVEDLLTEHNQLFGGADAVAVTAFDAPAKSIADNRWSYWMSSGPMMELWFGPQERITKRMIDAVYGARSSVWVLTDDCANEGLVAALQTKANHGFDIKIIVGPNFGDSAAPLSRLLQNEAPNVTKRQISTGRLPTMVLVDLEPARDNRYHPAKAFVSSHDLYSSSRFYRAEEVVTDQLVDGTLWVLNDYGHTSTELATLTELWETMLDQSGAL